jgi:hypothetical protein
MRPQIQIENDNTIWPGVSHRENPPARLPEQRFRDAVKDDIGLEPAPSS